MSPKSPSESPTTTTASTADASVLRSARKLCHAARDAYAACAPPSARGTKAGLVVPPECAGLREEFERACKKSWVDHFDLLRVKEADLAKKIQESIKRNEERGRAAGSLAGQRQG